MPCQQASLGYWEQALVGFRRGCSTSQMRFCFSHPEQREAAAVRWSFTGKAAGSGERGAALQQLFRLCSRETSHPAPWITPESKTNNVYIQHTNLSTVIWYTAYSKSQTSCLTVKHYNSVSRMKFLRKCCICTCKSYISIAVWYIDTHMYYSICMVHMCILVLFGLEKQKPDENVLLEEIVPEVHNYCSHIPNSEVVSQLLSWLTHHFLKNVK